MKEPSICQNLYAVSIESNDRRVTVLVIAPGPHAAAGDAGLFFGWPPVRWVSDLEAKFSSDWGSGEPAPLLVGVLTVTTEPFESSLVVTVRPVRALDMHSVLKQGEG